MRNLLKFLLKYYAVFLFVLLEFTALILVFQQNNYHNAVFINSSSGVMGFVNTHVNSITSYLNLKDENQNLTEENLRLRRMLENQLSTHPAYINKYTNAVVINNSVNRQKNYLTLNKGETQNIQKQMGVIGPQGIVGIIENTSKYYSSVIPIINKNFHVSAQFKKNDYYGSLSWDGNHYQIAQLSEIPAYVDVQKGDTIITSGFSSSFSKGELIGTVYSAEKSGASAFWTIHIKLFTDYRSLNNVYIINKALTEEQDKLERRHD